MPGQNLLPGPLTGGAAPGCRLKFSAPDVVVLQNILGSSPARRSRSYTCNVVRRERNAGESFLVRGKASDGRMDTPTYRASPAGYRRPCTRAPLLAAGRLELP